MDDFEPQREYIDNMPIFKIEESDSDSDSEELSLLIESPRKSSRIQRMCKFISSAFTRKKNNPSTVSVIDDTML